MELLVTTTFTAPVAWAPVTAVMVVELTTTTLVAATPPTVTVAPLWKLLPVMVTAVPPAVVPLLGLMAGFELAKGERRPSYKGAEWAGGLGVGSITATTRGWNTCCAVRRRVGPIWR